MLQTRRLSPVLVPTRKVQQQRRAVLAYRRSSLSVPVCARLLLALIFCLSATSAALAQQEPPTTPVIDNPELQRNIRRALFENGSVSSVVDHDKIYRFQANRNLEREAPVRSPRVLQQEQITPAAMRTVVELPAVADSYIASARPDQNFGADSLYIGYSDLGNGFGAERLLVRFDVANAIPANATINSARLRLRLAFASPTDDAAMGTVLRQLASHWNESTVTWNREPSWTDIDDRTSVGSALEWYEWEVSAQVSAWVGGAPNHGVEIIGDEQPRQRERSFYSRETNTPYFPRLVVDYTVIDDDQPPNITVNPLPAFVSRNFTVSWDGTDPGEAGIEYYDVQYRVDGGDWIEWLSETTATVEEFPDAQNGRTYEFRARGVDDVGNVEAFGEVEAATVIDIAPPTTSVTTLSGTTSDPSFTVSWSGSDNEDGSGIQYYDVRYQVDNGPWVLWQERTTQNSALFVAPRDGVYRFEARAVDGRGNVEPFTGAEANITVDDSAPFLDEKLYLPLLYR